MSGVGHCVGPFAHTVVLHKSTYTLCIPCGDAYHLWEMDQDYHVTVFDNVDLISLFKRLSWYLYAALSFTSNLTQFMGKTGEDSFSVSENF